VHTTRAGWNAVRHSLAWEYLRKQRRFLLLLLVVLPVGGVAYIPVIGLTRAMVDNGIVNQTVPLSYYLWRIVGLAILAGFFVFALTQTLARVAYQLEYDLRTSLYHAIQSAEVQQLDEIAGGQLITRSLSDLQIVQSVMDLLPQALALGPAIAGIGVYLFVISPPLALVTLLPVPVMIKLLRMIRPRLAALSWAELNERAEVTTAVDEPVRGIRVVKAFGREEDERASVAAAALRVFRYSMTRARLLARFNLPVKALPILTQALLLYVGARLVADSHITLGTFLIAFQLATFTTQLGAGLDGLISTWQYFRSAQDRLREVFAMGRVPVPPSDEGAVRLGTAPGIAFDDVDVVIEGRLVLDGLRLDAEPGEVVAVTGPPGSGKSTVAALACGLMQPTRGHVLVDGIAVGDAGGDTARRAVRAVRVVAEEPFLFADTLAENLRLGGEGDEATLRVALHAAAADDVVDSIDGGLHGVLGDRGLTLSGGQRQRVALARALVSPPRVLVLDDALSAVNPSLEEEIFARVRAHAPDTAVLLITRRRVHAHVADRVVYLPPPAEEMIAEAADEIATHAERFEEPVVAAAPTRSFTATARMDLESVAVTTEQAPVTDAVAEADHPVGGWEILRRFRWLVTAGIALVSLMTLGQIAPQFAFGSVSDLVQQGDMGAVDIRVALLVVVAFVTAFSAYGYWIVGQRFTQGVLYLFRRRQFGRLSRLGIDYYDREMPGQVSARLVWDLDVLRGFFQEVALFSVTQVAQIVIAFTALLVISPSVFPLVLVVAAVIIVMTAVNLPLNHRANERARDRLGHVTTKFEEDFLGRREIAQIDAGERLEQKFRASCWELRAARRRVQLISNSFSAAMLCIGQVTAVVVLYISGNEVLAGTISVGSALTLRLLAETATSPFVVLGDQYSQAVRAMVSWRRLDEPFAAPVLPVVADGAPECPALEGEVVFEHVDFSYPHTGRQVLRDVTFTVPAGGVTALVGVTGAGKSSVAKLLSRTYDPDRGNVRVDGLDLRHVDLASYRARLGVVPQDAFVFSGTVASNIEYGRPDAARAEVEAAVRAVGAADVLGLLTGGLDAPVEQDGTNLTTAQRQLIALARAWLTHPDVLVLDEATSALDPPLERAVVAAVAALGCTTLMVTHREDVVLTADAVVVLSEGRVVQHNTPAALRASGGHYDDLWGTDPGEPADVG